MPARIVTSRRLAAAVAVLVTVGACSSSSSAVPSTTTAATSTTTTAGSTTTVATTTTTTSTTTTTTTLPPIVLGFAGDTSFTHGLDARDPLGDATALLSAPDLMLVNLETTVAESDVGTAAPKRYTFKSPPHSVQLLSDAGIDGVQLANNHTLDFGTPALLRTLELLDEGDMPHAGAGDDPTAAYAPRFFDVDGWRIGVVAFSRVPCDWASSGVNSRPEVAWTCEPFVPDTMAAVAEAAADSDLTVVMVHWGIELDHCPQPYQRALAEAWVRSGADLIIGGHPHVLQGVEQVDGVWLVNSTGNFAFPSARASSAITALFDFTVNEDGISLQAHPIRIESGRPVPATGSDAAAILADLGSWSFGWTFDENGMAVPTDAAGACG